jgi:hypothetical protein
MGNARKGKSDSCHLLEMAFLGDTASNFYLTVAAVIRILSDGWIKDYVFVATNSFVEPGKKTGHSLASPEHRTTRQAAEKIRFEQL